MTWKSTIKIREQESGIKRHVELHLRAKLSHTIIFPGTFTRCVTITNNRSHYNLKHSKQFHCHHLVR